MKIQPLSFLHLLAVSITSALWVELAIAAAPATRPNIIFILTDDRGWADTTLYGHTTLHRTPNLERLARRSMVFTRADTAKKHEHAAVFTRVSYRAGFAWSGDGDLTTPDAWINFLQQPTTKQP